jgi:FkbM family methyltransferase
MTTLRVYYGTIEKNIDITDKVFQTLLVEDHLVFPADDNLRAELFSDPCFRVVKHIIISGLSNTLSVIDHKTVCAIDTRTNTILSDPALMRRLITKTALKPMQKVLALHSLLSLSHGSMRDEFPEQCMVMEFLTGKETVLEIGGNIGRNSLILSSILKSDQQLVVLECSTAISEQLQQNRSNNQLQFHIENAALSKTKLIQKGWRTIASNTVLDGYTEIKNITFAEIESKYNLQFDTLVLDCEGSFRPILHDFPEILTNIHTIVVENDYLTLREKEEVDAILQTSGFQCVYVKEGEEEAKYLKMACLSNFYEVWKKPTQLLPLERSMHKGAPFMEKYPHVLFFRYDKYNAIDSLFDHKEKMECSMQIISDPKELYPLYDSNYHVFVTYGKDEKEYHKDVYQVIASRMGKRWIHYQEIPSIEKFVSDVNHCYVHHAISDRVDTRPIFSIFTTCYKSYDKITRAYESILAQRLRDWEWVILDDSPDDAHFAFLKKKFHLEKRVRLYKRSCNSGNIGNVKNEAVGLCRGKYVLEMDHDDEILPDTLLDAMRAFSDKEVGFVYMDFINEYENGKNFWYGDFICKGYGGYYRQKYRNKWVDVYMTPNINNITLSHIVCLPNHPRMWRRETLLQIGNYSEFLPICDDQELIMRTALQTKVVKIPKLGYVQYMNDNNNNFSLIRNREINRLGPQFIVPQFYNMYQVHDKMKEKGAYEDEKYIDHASKLWTRGEFEHKYCNERIQYDYDMQYCILGSTTFLKNMALLQEEYKNPRVDFILLDGAANTDALCQFLDSVNCSRMKCYSLPDTPADQLKKYFHDLYRCCKKVQIIE